VEEGNYRGSAASDRLQRGCGGKVSDLVAHLLKGYGVDDLEDVPEEDLRMANRKLRLQAPAKRLETIRAASAPGKPEAPKAKPQRKQADTIRGIRSNPSQAKGEVKKVTLEFDAPEVYQGEEWNGACRNLWVTLKEGLNVLWRGVTEPARQKALKKQVGKEGDDFKQWLYAKHGVSSLHHLSPQTLREEAEILAVLDRHLRREHALECIAARRRGECGEVAA